MPIISVVIPSFNCTAYICSAIDSILTQIMQDFDIIVVDDGSTDSTREVLGRYSQENRVRYIYQENRGLPGARNTGARASTAKYVAFLDADDMLTPDALSMMSDTLDASGESWCVTDILKINGNSREIHRTEMPDGDLFYGILKDDFIRRGMFFRREDILAVGLYDESMKNREDWDLNIRMIESGRSFTYVPKPLYLYSWREGSITTGNQATMLSYTEQLLRKHHKRLADAGNLEGAKVYAETMWGLARNHFYMTRNFRKAFLCVKESLAYDPSPRRLFHPVIQQFQRLRAN
ncbi:MAG: glycosyltransferase [Caulobacteraceae bacterium]|nr:glycosyltransferase [Caulobacteraceae bacterium]